MSTGPPQTGNVEPSPDALASIITQVSQTHQPARAPRSARPQRGAAASKKQPARSTATPTEPEKPNDVSPESTLVGSAATPKLDTAPSTSQPSPTPASQPMESQSSRKSKKKKPWYSVFVCGAAHTDDDSDATVGTGASKSDSKSWSAANKKDTPLSLLKTSSRKSAASGPVTNSTVTRNDIAPEILAATSKGGASLPRDETADVLSGAVVPPGAERLTPKKQKRRSHNGEEDISLTPSSSDDEEDLDDKETEEEYMDEEERIIAQGGMGIPIGDDGLPHPLLVELTPSDAGRKCLVLDLDETLVHSSFKMIHSADFTVPVEIEAQVHDVYVIKRPGVDEFLRRMGEIYEIVVFTASLSKYADPVLDQLDIHHVVKHRLFRESCYNHKGNYVKDLSQLGRPIGETIIIDNSPASYIFHPNNAVPVSSWFNDPHDTELTDLQNFLADLAVVPDVRGVLDGGL